VVSTANTKTANLPKIYLIVVGALTKNWENVDSTDHDALIGQGGAASSSCFPLPGYFQTFRVLGVEELEPPSYFPHQGTSRRGGVS
jgi:hypothetical protein